MKSQGETIGVFTLIISEIATQKVEISSILKTSDKSDYKLFGFQKEARMPRIT
jgi:hypothetical protein